MTAMATSSSQASGTVSRVPVWVVRPGLAHALVAPGFDHVRDTLEFPGAE